MLLSYAFLANVNPLNPTPGNWCHNMNHDMIINSGFAFDGAATLAFSGCHEKDIFLENPADSHFTRTNGQNVQFHNDGSNNSAKHILFYTLFKRN